MKVRLSVPRQLKGMSSLRHFMLTLVATTISIVLTFGTSAVLDHRKKETEKREIVMMVMYDMYNTLESVKKADANIMASIDYQVRLARDTSLYSRNPFEIAYLMPTLRYTETVESIFSSSIESINTVGNVLFAENVSSFYRLRKAYKEEICDPLEEQLRDISLRTLEDILDYSYLAEASLSGGYLQSMSTLYRQCQEMMKVRDEDIDSYIRHREEMERESTGPEPSNERLGELQEKYRQLEEARKNLQAQ